MQLHYKSGQLKAIEAVKRYYKESEGYTGEGLLDIDVSYDGTWMTRGHKSHIGVGFVVECNTGFVLELEVLSNYCIVCSKKKLSFTDAGFAIWKQQEHKRCTKNFEGKSGAMEKEAAVRIWGRSEQLGLRYVTFLSDGDSAAFKSVTMKY